MIFSGEDADSQSIIMFAAAPGGTGGSAWKNRLAARRFWPLVAR
jgi:hypothetical protein